MSTLNNGVNGRNRPRQTLWMYPFVLVSTYVPWSLCPASPVGRPGRTRWQTGWQGRNWSCCNVPVDTAHLVKIEQGEVRMLNNLVVVTVSSISSSHCLPWYNSVYTSWYCRNLSSLHWHHFLNPVLHYLWDGSLQECSK